MANTAAKTRTHIQNSFFMALLIISSKQELGSKTARAAGCQNGIQSCGKCVRYNYCLMDLAAILLANKADCNLFQLRKLRPHSPVRQAHSSKQDRHTKRFGRCW